MPNNYQQHRYQTGSFNKNITFKKIKTPKWEKMSKTNFNHYTNPLGISTLVCLYIFMTFGTFSSTQSMTSKLDLIVNSKIYVHTNDKKMLHQIDSYYPSNKFQNKFHNTLKNFNKPY